MFTRCLCWWSWGDFKGLAVNELGKRRGNPPNYQGQSQFKWLSPKITRATILNNGKAIKNSQSAKPMLLTFPRLKARRLFCEFSRAISMDANWVAYPTWCKRNLEKWNLWGSQIHFLDDLYPNPTSMLGFSTGRSRASKEYSWTLERHFLLTFFGCSKKASWTKAAAALDSLEKSHADAARDGGERSEYLISAAHKRRSHKQKNEPKLVFIKSQRKFETLSKTHSLSTKSLEPQQSRQATSPMSIWLICDWGE